MRKTAFGDSRVIRGRFQWKAEAPPVNCVNRETLEQVRERVVEILSALTAVLLQHGKKHNPKMHEGNLFDFLGSKAEQDLSLVVEALHQADGRLREGLANAALLFYLNAFELVLEAKCQYGMLPETAFQED